MPLSALVRGKILCMHGGLSPKLNSLSDLKGVRIPFSDPPQNSLEQDLLWSDPNNELKGFEFNKHREVSVQFGEDVVQKTCKKLVSPQNPLPPLMIFVGFQGLDMIVRAHQVMANGYGFFANRKLVTVFSAPRYSLKMVSLHYVLSCTLHLSLFQNNRGAVMKISQQMVISFVILNPTEKELAGADNFRSSFKDDATSYAYIDWSVLLFPVIVKQSNYCISFFNTVINEWSLNDDLFLFQGRNGKFGLSFERQECVPNQSSNLNEDNSEI